MIDIELIREHPELVKAGLQKRDMEGGVVDEAHALDIRRGELLVEVEALKAERNAASKQIGAAKDDTEREEKIAAMRTVGDQIDALDAELGQVDQDLNKVVAVIPNLPFAEVPAGGEENNVVVKEVGDKPQFGFEAIPHWDLGPQL